MFRKENRKNRCFSKKAVAVCLFLSFLYAPIAADSEVLVSLFPHFTKPFGTALGMETGIGGGLRVTYRPMEFLNLFVQGDYLSMSMPGIEPISIINGSVGGGYHLNLSDRISLDFNMNIGAYNASSDGSVSGLSAGVAIVFSYKINPIVSVDVGASGTHFAAGSKPLMMMNTAISPGITFNITQMFNSSANIDMKRKSLAPVFPVLYSWYENNSFGEVEIINNEDTAITDVTVSFYLPQYMAQPKECGVIKNINKGESATVDLYSFFNEQILELTEKTDANSFIIVDYACLGQKRSKTFSMDVPVYGRNNMSWDDDRRAAVFVSSKDPAAMQFAKYVTSVVRENLRIDVPINIQYAMGIFETLNEFGLNYVVDPTSAFEDNIGTSAIDFLQFPYQTLMYKGGDCDDISILVCSLFETVGVRTAFITIPGHIFMAFDSGLTVEQAEDSLRNIADYIIVDDEVWVPLEITLSDEGFYKACRVGAREWNVAATQGKAALYKMSDSWKLYQPISVAGGTTTFAMPESETIAYVFERSMEEWGYAELKPLFVEQQPVRIASVSVQEPKREEVLRIESDAVVKEDPLSTNSLLDILAMAENIVAVVPLPVKEEYEEELAEEDDDNPDKLRPYEYAMARMQTDVPLITKDQNGQEIPEEEVKPATPVVKTRAEINAPALREVLPDAIVQPASSKAAATSVSVTELTSELAALLDEPALTPAKKTTPVTAETKVTKVETKVGVPEPVEGQKATASTERSAKTEITAESQLEVDPALAVAKATTVVTETKPAATEPVTVTVAEPKPVETKTNTVTKAETKSAAKEAKKAAKAEAKKAAKAEAAAKKAAKEEAKKTAKAETKPVETKTNTVTKVETKTAETETKTVTKAETKTAAKAETKTAVKVETKAATVAETKVGVPEPVEGQIVVVSTEPATLEQAEAETNSGKKSHAAAIALSVTAVTAAAGIIVYSKKKKKRDEEKE